MKRYIKFIIILMAVPALPFGCKKLIEIRPPISTITTSQVFATDDQAKSAAAGMYYNMINAHFGFSSCGMTLFGGASADELLFFNQTDINFEEFQSNSLLSSNGNVSNYFWSGPYLTMYSANAIIDNLANGGSGVHPAVKNELTGESEFVRAFCNFYLVNLFGDIPLVTTTNYRKTDDLAKSPQDTVYKAIIQDLLDAQNRLPPDYSAAGGSRILPNQWAAKALLARAYLYTGDWQDALAQSSAIINNTGTFSLTNNLNDVFLANNPEAIWQLEQDYTTTGWQSATPEGYQFIPFDATTQPYVYLTNSLLSSFESNDQRKAAWIDSTVYNAITYYYPYKYKVGAAQKSESQPTEFYMVLRLAEQYLIRAEAELHGAGGGTPAAIADLNIIRARAGLAPLNSSLTTAQATTALQNECRHEYFAEWGHRWLDLKRWGTAATVLSADKGFQVKADQLLYPIPVYDIKTDPNLIQNPGY